MNSVVIILLIFLIIILICNSKPIIECFQSTKVTSPGTNVQTRTNQSLTNVNAPGTSVLSNNTTSPTITKGASITISKGIGVV